MKKPKIGESLSIWDKFLNFINPVNWNWTNLSWAFLVFILPGFIYLFIKWNPIPIENRGDELGLGWLVFMILWWLLLWKWWQSRKYKRILERLLYFNDDLSKKERKGIIKKILNYSRHGWKLRRKELRANRFRKSEEQLCPHCSQDMENHTCGRCFEDFSIETCGKNDGFCEECFKFLKEEVPKFKAKKKELGVECECNNSECAKCLSGGCKDEDCPVHTQELKDEQ